MNIFTRFKFHFMVLIMLPVAAAGAEASSVNSELWTLEASIQRVQDVAPELRMADAEIGIRQGELTQVSAWPNPTLDVVADQKLGIEDGTGGTDLTLFSFTQAIPIKRLGRQRNVAEAHLSSAQLQRHYEQLVLELKTASVFHELQLANEKLQLAKKRYALASRRSESAPVRSTDQLVRYLTPVEQSRLGIVRESARQGVTTMEGKLNEALARFRALLLLPDDTHPKPIALMPMVTPKSLAALEDRMTSHALLGATKQELTAANASIAAARSRRFADPTLSVFRERDFLAGSRQTYTGVVVGVQIPLWNMNNGGVAKAQSEVYRVQAMLESQQRELKSRLHKSYLHLGHLVEQAEDFRKRLLKPTQEVFELTSKGFAAGELNVLALIDAYNTFFDARERYLELMYAAWQEAAELRFAAGLSLFDAKQLQAVNGVSK